ncbi:site-specific integrase [Rothia sp. ZJ932]|uniref:tyrosine-type recombinase/integrase n=1 Tax=Rothia sp. ZJ932 TaxID=2810516 RepID=UPI0019684060|nr:site-specific integrase [Rothia sp. ZJ932]QRZ61132.1 site-specific integrase [Rothia sp. ZJ932]
MPREVKPLGTHGKIKTTALPNGTYQADTRLRTHTGEIVRVRARGASAYKAETALKAKITEYNAPHRHNSIHPGTKITELATIWFERYKSENRAVNTLSRYEGVITTYIIPRMKGLTLKECSAGITHNVLTGIKDTHGYSSAKQTKTVLSNMFNLAREYDAIQINPTAGLKLKKESGHTKKAVDALSLDEVQRVTSALSGDILTVAQVMLGTGGRIGEVLALRWQDVDLTPGRAAIHFTGTFAQAYAGKPAHRQEMTKSDSSLRMVFIPDELAAILRDRAQNHIPAYAESTAWATSDAFVFPSGKGTILDPNNYRSRFRKQIQGANLGRDISPHIFRKTVATLVSSNDSLAVASQLLGHSSEKITEEYYIKKLSEQPNASKTLGVLFGAPVL